MPTEYAYKKVTLKAYINKIIIFYKDKKIAEHVRNFAKYQESYNYQHYLPILSQKSRALEQARPLQSLKLPKEFDRLQRVLEKRYEGTKGRREYIKILELLKQYTVPEIKLAIKETFKIGAINVDTIKQILYQKKEVRIKIFDKESFSGIPMPTVYPPSLDRYNDLLKNDTI